MASTTISRQKAAEFIFVAGWLLILLNIAVIVLANYAPFYLEGMTREAFFFIDEAAVTSRIIAIVSTCAYAGLLLQALFLGKVAHSIMKDDSPQVAAAEASLKLARVVAVVGLVLMFYGWFKTVQMDQSWQEGVRLKQLQDQRDWGG
jgi:hypothetical protein